MTESRGASDRAARLLIVIPLVIAAAAFSLHLGLELKLDSLQGFDVFNTFFGADPNKVIGAFSEGAGRQHVAHPNLPHFFSLPLRGLVKLAGAGRTAVEQKLMRRSLAMFIVPLAAALQCFAAFRVFSRLGLRPPTATLLTLLGCVSFSQVIFGSMPESFGLSGLAITLAYLVALQSEKASGRVQDAKWLGVAVFGTGVTITNIVPLGLLYWMGRRRSGSSAGTTLKQLAAVVVAAVAIVFTLRGTVNAVSGVEAAPVTEREYISAFLVPDPGRHAMMFPSAVMNGLAPSKGIWALRNELWEEDRMRRGGEVRGYPYKFTMQTPRVLSPRNLAGIALLALVTAAALRLRRIGHRAWPYCAASMVLLAFSWALHSIWGEEQFLYSQHWQFPLLVLIAGVFLAFDRVRRFHVPALAAAVLYVGITNAVAVRRIVGVMETWFRGAGGG